MKPLFQVAIYVNRKPSSLTNATHGGEPSEPLTENKAWKSGGELFQEAQRAGCELPLIFGYYAPLKFWALANEITVVEGKTTYRFTGLQKITGGYQRRDLTVLKSQRPLSNDFIRSYAIVQTPPFIDTKRGRQEPVGKVRRNDAQSAAKIMNNAFQTQPDFDSVLAQLSESINTAKSVAPNAWAVTLFPDGFRLNVGRVEVLTAFDGEIRLLMHGAHHSVPKQLRDHIQIAPYRSVPGDNYIFRGSVEQFRVYRDDLIPAHHDFIAEAGRTRTGRPVKGTRYRAFHSPGLVDLAESVALHDSKVGEP